MDEKEILSLITKGDPEVAKKVEKILKDAKVNKTEGDGQKVAIAMKAVARIVAPLKDQISKEMLDQVYQAAGIPTESEDAGEPAESDMIKKGDGVSDEQHKEAMKVAKSAYCESVKKLAVSKEDSGGKEKEDRVEKEKVAKTTEDLIANVPDAVRPAVEAIFKSQQELVKKNEELSKENTLIKKELGVEQEMRKNREFIAKAEKYTNLGISKEEVAKVLRQAADVSVEQLTLVEKAFEAANGAASKSEESLFGELGSNQAGSVRGGNDAWEKIEKAASNYVEKSGETGLTTEQATAKFLETPEGQRLYGEYKNQRGGV